MHYLCPSSTGCSQLLPLGAVAHLHHLPVLSSVERVELVGSDLVGRGWRGAVVFTSALRHVLLGLRECLLISWGDGVREC